MTTYGGRVKWLGVIAVAACSNAPSGGNNDTSGADDDASASTPDDGPDDDAGPTTDEPAESTGTPGTTEDEGGETSPWDGKFDVHGVDAVEECETLEAGVYCKDGSAVQCDGNGGVVSTTLCTPDICLPGTGCVECLEGQHTCSGPRVLVCNTDGAQPHWEEVELCNPAGGEACMGESGSCEPSTPVGDTTPTGQYYQYAIFYQGSSEFMGGYDVDCWEDKLYVSSNFGQSVDVYQVTIEDGDGGGVQPNQHPDNPEETGPVEPRTITWIETIPSVMVSGSTAEIFALEDRIYVGGYQNLTEYVFGEGSSVITTPPNWLGSFAQIGYDDINGVWYASNENMRRVYQYDADSQQWGIAFTFPNLAGDHMDGLEVVADPNTGIPYVYVSDMTSDFIGQYKLDPELGWIQQNLFSYADGTGSVVEGMGFGTFYHFWATGGNLVYELGGGELQEFVEPEPEG
jgi:hypothetical protein